MAARDRPPEATSARQRSDPASADAKRSSPRRAWTIFCILAAAYFLSYFYRSTNAVIAEDLTADLGIGAAELGLLTSLFFLSFAAVQLPLGPLLDRFGARFVTSGLMLVAAGGSLLFGVAGEFWLLAVGRALIGVGMAGVLMGSLKAFSGWFSERQFATVSGLFLGVGSLGALAATTPLAALDQSLGWRGVFVAGSIVVLASALAIALFVRAAPGSRDTVPDKPGESVSPAVVFRSGTFWRIALLGLAVTGSMFSFQGLWAGPYLADRFGLPQLVIGNYLLLMSLGVSSGYMLVGWIADRVGLIRMIVMGATGLVVVELLLAFLPSEAPGWAIGALFLLFGLFGSFSVLFFAHARKVFPLRMVGRAVTSVNLLGIGGSALLQWLLGVLIGAFGTTARGGYPSVAYTATFLALSLLVVVTLAFYLPLAKSRSGAIGS